MCTQARRPSPSRRTEIASSKSFAVSGSIVNASCSRRATRPSGGAGRASGGSCSSTRPSCSSSASSTLSTGSAGPSTFWSRARPPPPATTAACPGRTASSPRRSRTSGTPGVKNGSPTTRRPRRPTSTTTRAASYTLRKGRGGRAGREAPGRRPPALADDPVGQLHPQEAAEREAGAGCTEQQPHRHQDQRDRPERERLDPRAAVEPRDDRGQRDLLAQEEQDDREDRAAEPADQPLEHERPATEPVRGADELHHLDLTTSGEDRESDRVRDQDRRRSEQDQAR